MLVAPSVPPHEQGKHHEYHETHEWQEESLPHHLFDAIHCELHLGEGPAWQEGQESASFGGG
jgi:hypothetical protein